MGARRIDAWERIQARERNRLWYFFKYTLKDWMRRVFKADFPEELLCTTFNLFYKNGTGITIQLIEVSSLRKRTMKRLNIYIRK